jgi:hypothetical protein
MKTLTLLAASAALLALVSCDARVNTSPPGETIKENTTIINPPAKEENKTIIVNPPTGTTTTTTETNL